LTVRVFISCASEDIDDAMAVKTWPLDEIQYLQGILGVVADEHPVPDRAVR
jgi:hypothetical protein